MSEIRLESREYNEYILALSLAITNAINVLNRVTFTANSVENFIKSHENEYQILKTVLKIKKTPFEWLTTLIGIGLRTDEQNIKANVANVLKKLKKKQPDLYREIYNVIYEEEPVQEPVQKRQNDHEREEEEEYFSPDEDDVANNAPRVRATQQQNSQEKPRRYSARRVNASSSKNAHNLAELSSEDESMNNRDDVIQIRENNVSMNNRDDLIKIRENNISMNNRNDVLTLRKDNESMNNRNNFPSFRTNPESMNNRLNHASSRTHDDSVNSRMISILSDLADKVNNVRTSRPNRQEIRIESLKNKSQDVKDWFSRFELQTARWSDGDRSEAVPCFFEELALQKFKLMNDIDKAYYTRIKEHIVASFIPLNHAKKCFTEFFNMRQRPSESVDDFATRLLNKIEEIDISERMTARRKINEVFMNGLSVKMQEKLCYYENEDFDFLVAKAQRFESLESLNKSIVSVKEKETVNWIDKKPVYRTNTNTNKQSSVDLYPKKVCSLCGRNGHIAETCERFMIVPRPKENRNNQFPKYSDNKFNSNSKYNPPNQIKNSNVNKRDQRKNSDEEYENIVKCSHCNRPGHNQKQCWELNPQLKPAKFTNKNRNSKN